MILNPTVKSKKPSEVSSEKIQRFYESPPEEDVSLEEFEMFALDRLRMLREIDEAKSRGKKHDEFQELVLKLWSKYMGRNSQENKRKDAISHFALRLAYCRTEELRKWFLTQEVTVFRCLFKSMLPNDQDALIQECKLPYEKVKSSSENEHVQAAMALMPKPDTSFYKVPFEEVPDLVATRKVYLHKGFAFVGKDQLASLICTGFRAHLSKKLVQSNRFWLATVKSEEKDRIVPMVEMLTSRYIGTDYSKAVGGGQVSIADLDILAQKSFPLCMKHLFYKLKEDHHLKHGGRIQLGLFLKGIGLSLDEAMAFWRSEFTRKMSNEKFEKEYSYNIRYNYGKEGKRVDYTPYSCSKVIMSTPGVGDHHGCPFRHFSEENLRSALGSMRLGPRAVNDVMDKVKGQHFQVACSLTFEACHGKSCETGINHPNQYFEESQKLLNPKEDDKVAPITPVEMETS